MEFRLFRKTDVSRRGTPLTELDLLFDSRCVRVFPLDFLVTPFWAMPKRCSPLMLGLKTGIGGIWGSLNRRDFSEAIQSSWLALWRQARSLAFEVPAEAVNRKGQSL